MADNQPGAGGPGAGRWIWVALTSVLVIGAVAYPFLRELDAAAGNAASADEAPAVEGPEVQVGKQFYVLLGGVEVAGKKQDGARWDVGQPAPDLFYEIRWKDTVVFRSSRKDDTLLARWNAGGIDLTDLLRKVSVDDSIEAARITVREGESLEFIVWDHDVASDDEVGRWTVATTALRTGVEVWSDPAPGIVSARCRVIAIDDVDLGTLTK